MEKIKNSYETLYVIDPDLSEEAVKGLVDKFNALIAENGTVGEVAEWGKKRLAYPINDLPEGYYVLMNFESNPAFPAEMERVMKITEGILRCLTTVVEG